MASERVTYMEWKCDMCGQTERVDSPREHPANWTHMAWGSSLSVPLGNGAAQHLCEDCSDELRDVFTSKEQPDDH